MKPLIFGLFVVIATLAAASRTQKLTGVITDSMCAAADHSSMRMGPTDRECTIACIMEHGAVYVLYDGKNSWTLSDQKTPEKFAGQKVTVTGQADDKTKLIEVKSIALAK